MHSWSPARIRYRQCSFVLPRDQRIGTDVAQVLIEQSLVSTILSLGGQLHLF